MTSFHPRSLLHTLTAFARSVVCHSAVIILALCGAALPLHAQITAFPA